MATITVTGGKGGTGKTVVAVNLAIEAGEKTRSRVLLVDLDVDNPCTYTVLRAKTKIVKKVTAFSPSIDHSKCTLCGRCVEKCPAHALILIPGKKLLYIGSLCEGCAICLHVCPEGAVSRSETVIGSIREGSRSWVTLLVGELKPGDRRHHEVMEETLKYMRNLKEDYGLTFIDTPPGSGKGVYLAIREADLIVEVTEPTRLGLLDLDRVHRVARKLGKRELVVINKYGIPGGFHGELEDYLHRENLEFLRVSYSRRMLEAYVRGVPILLYDPGSAVAEELRLIAEKIFELLR